MELHAPAHASADGYANLTRVIARELDRLGYNPPRLNLLLGPTYDPTNAHVHFTMYESTELPENAVALLNTRRLIIVPNAKDADDFRACGVRPQIEVCPLYCEGKFEPFAPIRPLTFLHVGAEHGIPERKRQQFIIDCFVAAFPREADVRLVIKRSPHCAPLHTFDKRVQIVSATLAPEELAKIYAEAHVGVFPGGMESWCLPAAELAARGRASIIPLYRGPAEFLTPPTSFSVPYTLGPAPVEHYARRGQCAHVTADGLISAMQFAYANPYEVYARGLFAHDAVQQYSPQRFGARLRDILSNYVNKFGPNVGSGSASDNQGRVGEPSSGDRSAAQTGAPADPRILELEGIVGGLE